MSTSREDYRAALRAMTDEQLAQECLLRIRAYREEQRQAARYMRFPDALIEWYCNEVRFFCTDTQRLGIYSAAWEQIAEERAAVSRGNAEALQRLKRDEDREQED